MARAKGRHTHETTLEAHGHAGRAKPAAHEKDGFTSLVSITVAVLAVAAAATGSLEAFESASAIIEANKAVLFQEQASDQWNLYEFKSLKKNIFQIAADAGGVKAADNRAKSQAEGKDQPDAQAKARVLEAERETALKHSAAHEARHHRLAVAATLLEIGIAISTIVIITRQRWLWLGALGLGATGAVVAAVAYLL